MNFSLLATSAEGERSTIAEVSMRICREKEGEGSNAIRLPAAVLAGGGSFIDMVKGGTR